MQTATPNPSWTTRFEGPAGRVLIVVALISLLITSIIGMFREDPMMIAMPLIGIVQFPMIAIIERHTRAPKEEA